MEKIKINHERKVKEIKNKLQKFPSSAAEPNLLCEPKKSNIDYPLNYKWNLDLYGPSQIIGEYSNVSIRNDYKIVAYHYSALLMNNHGILEIVDEDEHANLKYKTLPNSIVMAVPKNINLPECVEYIEESPIFDYTKESFMVAIDGDHKPLSYLQAAMVYDRLQNRYSTKFNTSADIILPFSEKDYCFYKSIGSKLLEYEWDMVENDPEILEPHFYYNETELPVVIYNTIKTGLPNFYGTSIRENKFVFDKKMYKLNATNRILGSAPMELWL